MHCSTYAVDRDIYGEPRQENYGDGVPRKTRLDALCRLVRDYGSRCQTIITEDLEFFRKDIGLRVVRLLVIPCLTFQKSVQVFFAAIEALESKGFKMQSVSLQAARRFRQEA